MLPLTYDECLFRGAALAAGAVLDAYPIEAQGPNGQALTIDVAVAGDPAARRALVVLSGVHGVEGFAPSAIQCELLGRSLPPVTKVVAVHAVNPWGMAWWRRQNENNVDLNRNWSRDAHRPPANSGYEELHPLLVPGGHELPSADAFLDAIAPFRKQHGIAWIRDAVSRGQYTHPDGLYFGGAGLEASTQILRSVAQAHLAGAEVVLTVDLHTGHGKFGTFTLLSHVPSGTDGDRWLRRWFDDDRSPPATRTQRQQRGSASWPRGWPTR